MFNTFEENRWRFQSNEKRTMSGLNEEETRELDCLALSSSFSLFVIHETRTCKLKPNTSLVHILSRLDQSMQWMTGIRERTRGTGSWLLSMSFSFPLPSSLDSVSFSVTRVTIVSLVVSPAESSVVRLLIQGIHLDRQTHSSMLLLLPLAVA